MTLLVVIDRARQRLHAASKQLVAAFAPYDLKKQHHFINVYEERCHRAFGRYFAQHTATLLHFESRLKGVSPYSVLARGYAMVMRGDPENGYSPATRAACFSPHEHIRVRLHDGELSATVEEILNETEKGTQ